MGVILDRVVEKGFSKARYWVSDQDRSDEGKIMQRSGDSGFPAEETSHAKALR